MTADRAALVERVAEIMCCESPCQHPDGDTCCAAGYHAQATDAIDLIRNEVLEEAAKVAEYRCGSPEWSSDTNSGYECAAKEIAAAIRALKGGT